MFSVFGGLVADLLGSKLVATIIPAAVAIPYLALAFTGPRLWYLVAVAIALHLVALGGPAVSSLISRLAPKEYLGSAFSLYRTPLLIGSVSSSVVLAPNYSVH